MTQVRFFIRAQFPTLVTRQMTRRQDAQCSNGEKHTSNSEWQNAYGVSRGKETKRFLDPASMNPEQLTSTPTKQDLLHEEILKLAMMTHLEVQQREDILRDLAERMKCGPPDLRVGESVFYWQKNPNIIQQKHI